MPNLVGIGLSQVPTNGMLGGLAYQDPESVSIEDLDLKNLSRIKALTNDTAVDIFVYDTRKDSDGGAWRKRTQHTTWYNETLNTPYRGSRREFPAVAVIVATIDDVIIYDGDDADLPMWMKFESSDTGTPWTTHFIGRSSTFSGFSPDITSIAMLNASLVVCKDGGNAGNFSESYNEINFIRDNCIRRDAGSAVTFNNPIVDRNGTAGSYRNSPELQSIYDEDLLDVAMTVLPSAPIDERTGLPIPTIAIGTRDGTSIVQHDGIVHSITSATDIHHQPRNVSFYGTKLLFTEGNDYDLQDRVIIHTEVPSGTIDLSHTGALPNGYTAYGIGKGAAQIYSNKVARIPINNELATRQRLFTDSDSKNNIFVGCRHAQEGAFLTISEDSKEMGISGYNGMMSLITSDYNTGYMVGDIKGAYLSDTDTTNLSSPSNLIPSSSADFSSSSGWSLGTGWTISGGKLNKTTNDNNTSYYTATGLTIGKAYTFAIDLSVAASSGTLYFYARGSYTNWPTISGTGTHSLTVVANSTSMQFGITSIGGIDAKFDNAWLSLGEADRSERSRGLRTYGGSITKEPVARGAELVGYSGFDSGNYMRFDASEMAFGTGDFSVSVWVIPSTDESNEFILELDNAQDSNRFYLLTTSTAEKRLYLPWDSDVAGSELSEGVWNHIVVGRRGLYGFVYVNGKWVKDGYKSYMTSLNGNGYGMVGNYAAGPSTSYAWSGSIALLRISGTAPSDAQVKKMYDQEKQLFQENAKATIYGSSNAVTAIAYDDSTNIVHVGTSAGRSEFRGLSRINNTTTAVTTKISASNGLVAEQ